MKPWPNKSPASNRRWRCQFRYRGSRHESAVAQLFSLGGNMRMSFLRLFAGMVCLVASAFFGFQTFGAIAMSRFLGGADDGTLIVLGMSFPERYSSFVICLLGLIALCFILFGVYVLRSRKVAA